MYLSAMSLALGFTTLQPEMSRPSFLASVCVAEGGGGEYGVWYGITARRCCTCGVHQQTQAATQGTAALTTRLR